MLFRSPSGRVLQKLEAAGTSVERLTTTSWHEDWDLPLTIQQPGRRSNYQYDAVGNLLYVEHIATGP